MEIMKSKSILDLRTPYCTMIFKRTPQEQITARQAMVRYAQQHGNKPAARRYGCDVRTVRMWRKRFEEAGPGFPIDAYIKLLNLLKKRWL